jgi:hypothetical protein
MADPPFVTPYGQGTPGCAGKMGIWAHAAAVVNWSVEAVVTHAPRYTEETLLLGDGGSTTPFVAVDAIRYSATRTGILPISPVPRETQTGECPEFPCICAVARLNRCGFRVSTNTPAAGGVK